MKNIVAIGTCDDRWTAEEAPKSFEALYGFVFSTDEIIRRKALEGSFNHATMMVECFKKWQKPHLDNGLEGILDGMYTLPVVFYRLYDLKVGNFYDRDLALKLLEILYLIDKHQFRLRLNYKFNPLSTIRIMSLMQELPMHVHYQEVTI